MQLGNGTKIRLPEISSFRLLSETRRNLRIPYLKTAALDLKQKIVAQMLAQFLCEKPTAVAASILHGPTQVHLYRREHGSLRWRWPRMRLFSNRTLRQSRVRQGGNRSDCLALYI